MEKVLHVVNTSFVLPYFIGTQFEHFRKKGIEFHVACTESDHLFEYAKIMNFKCYPLKIERKISPIVDLISIIKLAKYIRRERISIVIGHTPKGAMIAMIASLFIGLKNRVYFRHGIMYQTSKGMKRKLLIFIEKLTGFCATKVVCVSNSVMRESITERLNDINKNIILGKGTCNGIDGARFSKSAIALLTKNNLKKSYNIQDDDIVIGFIGRLVNDKGVSELIEAWEILIKKYSNIKLLLVGPFEPRDSLNDNVKKYIIESKSIINTGLIGDVLPYYSLMNIFILPSYREGFPTVILEASAMELPIITSRSTGCIDSIIENETGIFCSIDSADIVRKIEFYIENPEYRNLHGQQGRKFVLENFDQNKVWDEIEDNILALNMDF